MNIFGAFFEKPKGIHFATQEPGEKIIFILRRSIVTNIPWIVISTIGLILPIIYMRYVLNNPDFSIITPQKFETILLVVWWILVILYTIESFITWYFNTYIVTDQRLIDVDFTPLFNKRVSETTYDKIEDTAFNMTNVVQTVFNYGNVFVQTAAEKREFEFDRVPKPARVQDVISDLADKAS
jgi:hypothetical protein